MKMRQILSATLAIACLLTGGCRSHREPSASDLFNDHARLDAPLPYPVLEWRALTTSVDRNAQTTSTLFGNDAAADAARSGQASYPAGAVLGLVTWHQRDDPHWFGARIPDAPASVEFMEFGAGAAPVYRRFEGSPLSERSDSTAAVRIAAIESMKSVRLP